MLNIYQGEQRDGRMKFTSDVDCLPADIIRMETRVFDSLDSLIREALRLELSGWTVCVDVQGFTDECGNLCEYFYETDGEMYAA